MAIVRPFKAIRPNKQFAEKIISLPYDVMNREEAAAMAKGNPYSFLHICRSEIDLPEEKDPYAEKVYERARDNIRNFLEKKIFIEEAKPMFYLYRQYMGDAVQTGLVGCVSLDEYIQNKIKKHELTRKEKEEDRIKHFDICSMNTEPVFLTYRDNKKIGTLIEGYISNNEPEYDVETSDGVRHKLWAIVDENVISGLAGLFAEVPSLYIADGHHRSASACKVGLKRRKENPGYTGEEEFNYFMAAIFPAGDLKIFDYNRVVRDLNGNTEEEFIQKIKDAGFSVKDMGNEKYEPEARHFFGMFMDGRWYRLKADESMIPEDIIGALDVSVLQENILAPVLGIEDPRTDRRIDFVGGIRGLSELEKRAGSDMKVAFAMNPVDIKDLLNVADNGMVMPPKSTWFEPKLGSGLFMHRI